MHHSLDILLAIKHLWAWTSFSKVHLQNWNNKGRIGIPQIRIWYGGVKERISEMLAQANKGLEYSQLQRSSSLPWLLWKKPWQSISSFIVNNQSGNAIERALEPDKPDGDMIGQKLCACGFQFLKTSTMAGNSSSRVLFGWNLSYIKVSNLTCLAIPSEVRVV